MHWNHRILTDGNKWWIGEVYYDDTKPIGCTNGNGTLADWATEDELRTVALNAVLALTKPPLKVKNNQIVEELP